MSDFVEASQHICLNCFFGDFPVYLEPYLRLVEDSEGLRLSLRGVQGVAAGVPSSVLVITQEDDAGTGFRLERKQSRGKNKDSWTYRKNTYCLFQQIKLLFHDISL